MELMVVLAILAVLIALSFPVYHAARQRGNVTRSIHNLKQIHLALQLYAETHGQDSPLGFGLPHRGLGTLLELNMIPRALTQTGGTNFIDWDRGSSSVYVWFPPHSSDYHYEQLLREWQEYVNRTNGNPALMLDKTHNPLAKIHDPFYAKLCIVLWADGSVQTTRRTGTVGALRTWERR